MRVKRFIVDSMPDAIQRIRAELGKDAVILNSKEIRTGGILGMFGKKRIEVIAATDTTASPAPAAHPPVASARETAPSPAVAVLEKPSAPDREIELLAEVRQMKEMLKRLSSGALAAPSLPAAFDPLEKRLLEQEVLPDIVADIFDSIMEQSDVRGEDWTASSAREAVRQKLIDVLGQPVERLQPDTKIAHFVGPTGVGKTTTIAKLAAEQVLKYNRKVGFITSDTYRIAAIEQLKVYANILNAPLEVVFSPQEMNKALQSFADMDVIFMDTAGRNYRNELYVSELNAMLRGSGKSETYLVLSLTSKYEDMKAIVDNFAKMKLDKILYTKMDETETFGSIVNLAWNYGLQNSYITTGQNVPDDILELNRESIADLILGVNEHE